MIDFGNFYSLIAKNHLSHWLETLLHRLPTGNVNSSTVCLNSGPMRWNFCPKLNRIVLIYCIA